MLGRCSSRAPSTTLRLQVPRRPIPPLLGPAPVHARVHSTTARPVAPRPAQRPASRLTTHRGGPCSAHRGAPPPCSTGPLRAATDAGGRPPGARRAAASPRAPPPGRSRPAPPPPRRAAQRAAGPRIGLMHTQCTPRPLPAPRSARRAPTHGQARARYAPPSPPPPRRRCSAWTGKSLRTGACGVYFSMQHAISLHHVRRKRPQHRSSLLSCVLRVRQYNVRAKTNVLRVQPQGAASTARESAKTLCVGLSLLHERRDHHISRHVVPRRAGEGKGCR